MIKTSASYRINNRETEKSGLRELFKGILIKPKEETKMAKSTWQYEYSTKNHHRYVNADGDNIYIPRFVSASYPTAEITIFTSIKSAKRSGTVKAVVKDNDPVVGYEG